MPSVLVISVVIPAHNDAHNLRRLLPALATGFASAGLPFEVIVVANGCTDDSVACCQDHGARCVERPALSPAAARNEGTSAARGTWLAFLDADVEPRGSWFSWIARRLTLTGSPSPSPILAGWPVSAPMNAGWVAHAWERVRFSPAHLPRTLDCANIVVPRDLFRELGAFDANRVAGEDVEFCERAIAAGVPIVFDEALAVYHFGEPRGLSQFFSRELFHADPLHLVVRTCRQSSLDATLIALAAAVAISLAAAIVAVAGGPSWLWSLVLLAPAISVGGALAKAGVKWHRGLAVMQFVQMVFLCQVMMSARVAGMFLRRKTWRTSPRRDSAD
jgi:GT2 family glycosyltransferase